jgi:hypothetical protein
LARPRNIDERIAHEMSSPHWRFDGSPRHAIEVDARDFRRELLQELTPIRARWSRRASEQRAA